MTLRTATLKGQKPRNFKTSKRVERDADLKEKASIVSSARGILMRSTPTILRPDNVAKQNEIANELLEWNLDGSALTIEDFCLARCISPANLLMTAETNTYLAACLDVALARIGKKLADMLKDNSLFLLANEKRYSAIARYEAKLKRESDSKNYSLAGTVVYEPVGIPSFNEDK